LVCPLFATAQAPHDSDLDGLSDEQEQQLLETFRPIFMIDARDCAGLPASFTPGIAEPEQLAQDGTIYGQVFPLPNSNHVEVHYYTLWNRDCGRSSHPLDVEHVSALIESGPQQTSKALYWYAGAHEDTLCDISSAARAESISSEHQGPTVWISSGKHAMFLRKSMCGHGCGADVCEDGNQLRSSAAVINLGEKNAPANGALWINSPQWSLATKMVSDFSPDILARLDVLSGDATVLTVRGSSSMRGTIQVSGTVVSAAAVGADHTGAALGTANSQTSSSLGKATRATGRSLKRAWKAVFSSK